MTQKIVCKSCGGVADVNRESRIDFMKATHRERSCAGAVFQVVNRA